MQKIIFIFLLCLSVLSCKDKADNASSSKKEAVNKAATIDIAFKNSFVYKEEQEQLARKRKLCGRLALYDIEKEKPEYELRLWLLPSMWDPSILYVLKSQDSTWTLFHYQYYTLGATGVANYYNNPKVDSVVMESVRPQRTTWQSYVSNLNLDNLWGLETESDIKGKEFGVVDGHRYLLEINQRGRYKYLFYTTPEHFQDKDINHKKFIEFKKRLVDAIIYNGMRNP